MSCCLPSSLTLTYEIAHFIDIWCLCDLIGLSYKRKDLLWSKAWNVKCVQNWQIYPSRVHLPLDLNGNFWFEFFELILADQLTDLPPQVDLPLDLNGNFRFLLLELIWADQLADLHSQVDLPVDLNGNFRFLLLELIWADQLADLPSQGNLPMHLNGNFTFLLSELILPFHRCLHWELRQTRWQIYPPKVGRSTPQVDLPVHLNGNFRFLLSELIWADQLADLPLPPRVASGGQEGQFHISTVRAHIGRSTPTPQIVASNWSYAKWKDHFNEHT